MASLVPEEFYFQSTADRPNGFSVTHKFGLASVGTSFAPIARGGVYRMPQVSSATTLRVAAGNAADSAAGAGAREITLEGLDETGAKIQETLVTAGASASATTTNTFIRLYRAFVSQTGTYTDAVSSSHSGDIVIENGAGGTTWATISSTDTARSQTQIGWYSTAFNERAYINNVVISVDAGNNDADVIFAKRENILAASAPYSAMRASGEYHGMEGFSEVIVTAPIGPFPPLTDFGFIGKADAGTDDISVDFEIISEVI